MKEHVTVTQPEAARALTDTAHLRMLEPFLKQETSLSEVAQHLDIKLNTLLYHVNKFITLGLLEVVREVPRRGKATKLYRNTAKAFFIPFEATSSASLEEFLFELTHTEEKVFHREAANTFCALSPEFGFHISLNTQDQLSLTISNREKTVDPKTILGPNAPALFVGDGSLHLDSATAKAFQNDLFELLKQYSEKQVPDAQLYAYRLGLTPVIDISSVKS